MPPRLHCLNAARSIVQNTTTQVASFTTQNAARASGHQLLSRIAPEKSGNQASMQRLLDGFKREARNPRSPGQASAETLEQLKNNKLGQDLSRQISRRWRAGDVYAPHDISAVEMAKWKRRVKPEFDVFDMLDLNPMKEYKNYSMLSEYISQMGRIMPRSETGLRPVNQRRIAKAIRRAIGMGLMPSVHLHPEIIQKKSQRSAQLTRI